MAAVTLLLSAERVMSLSVTVSVVLWRSCMTLQSHTTHRQSELICTASSLSRWKSVASSAAVMVGLGLCLGAT